MRRFFRSLLTTSGIARTRNTRPNRKTHTLRRSPRVEYLEDRAVPTATLINVTNVNVSGATTYNFDVKYSNAIGYDTTSFGKGDIVVINGAFNGTVDTITIDNTDNTNVIVTYQMVPPGGRWDATDNGTFLVNVQASQVTLNDASTEPAATAGTFVAYMPSLTATNVTAAAVGDYTFNVTYATSPNNYDVSTLGGDDIRVTGPNGFNQLAVLSSSTPAIGGGNTTPITVTYKITPPGGGWSLTNRGIYTATLDPGTVSEVAPGGALPTQQIGTVAVAFNDGANGMVVSTNDDVDDGDFRTGFISLREAVRMSQLKTGADTISFDTAGLYATAQTITMDTLNKIEYQTDQILTITGPGSSKVTIDGKNESRIFHFFPAGTSVAISGMTLVNGNGDFNGNTDAKIEPNDGGAIMVGNSDATSSITFAMTDVKIMNSGDFNTPQGGGIYVGYDPVMVSIKNSTISGCNAKTGGGIYFAARGGFLLENSTISGCNALAGKGGGGIYWWGNPNANGFNIRNSTVANNSSDAGGGGLQLYNWLSPGGTVRNSTFSGNANTAPLASVGTGGGISVHDGAGVLTLRSNIIAGNTDSTGVGPDLAATFTSPVLSNNVLGVGDTGFSMDTTSIGNVFGTAAAPLDAKLGALGLNGGTILVETMLPAANSPAYNAGSNATPALTTDTRGLPRQAGSSTATFDAGAVESTTSTPTAVASAPVVIGGGAATYGFSVTYESPAGIDTSTINSEDVTVTGPGFGAPETVSFSGPVTVLDGGNRVVANYVLTPPGGFWNAPDTGVFVIHMSGTVSDTVPVNVPARQIGAFSVSIQPPSAVLAAPAVVAVQPDDTFTVTYTGSFPIDYLTIDSKDIRVIGPGGFNQLATPVSPPTIDMNPMVVTYKITPPGGFSLSNRGRYVVSLEVDEVKDKDGVSVAAATLGNIIVAIPNSGATFEVDIVADEDDGDFKVGDTSLREALIMADAAPGANTVTFTGAAFAGAATIDLGAGVATHMFIESDVVVQGTGKSNLTLSGGDVSRIFVIGNASDPTVTLSGMTLTKGRAGTDSTTLDGGYGAGLIQLGGSLTLTNVAFTNNTAGVGSAALHLAGMQFSADSVSVTNSVITNGAAGFLTSAVFMSSVTATIDHSDFSNNTMSPSGQPTFGANAFGAAMTIIGPLTIRNSSFSNNTGAGTVGIFTRPTTAASTHLVEDVTFSNNFDNISGAGQSNGGAALYFDNNGAVGNSAIVRRSAFTNNKSFGGPGGAMRMPNILTGQSLLIEDSLFNGNTATTSQGGAVAVGGAGNLTVRNTTMAGNFAGTNGGAIRTATTGTVTIQNSTLAFNTASTGSGGGISRGAGTIVLDSSIVAKNVSAAGGDVTSTVTVVSNLSLVGNTSGAAFSGSGNQFGNSTSPLDPQLVGTAPANNGNPTLLTFALQPTSPALNAGRNSAGLLNDERGTGFNRTGGFATVAAAAAGGDGTDIGAHENLSGSPITVTSIVIDDGSGQRSMIQSITVTFSEAPNFPGGMAAAFQLARLATSSTPAPAGNVTLAFATSGNSVTITFNDPTFAPLIGSTKSLIDGKYEFTIFGTKVNGLGGFLDGPDADSFGGDNVVTNFGKIYGDGNGDGIVNQADFTAFRNAFNNGPSNTWDYEGDGNVTQSDFTQFRNRFNLTP